MMKKHISLLLPVVILLAEVDIYSMQNSLNGTTLPSFAELLKSLNEPLLLKQKEQLLKEQLLFISPINSQLTVSSMSEQPVEKKWNMTHPNNTTTTNTPFVEEQGSVSSSSSTLLSDDTFLLLIQILKGGKSVNFKLKQQTLRKLFDGAVDSTQRFDEIISVLDKRKQVPHLLSLFIDPISKSEDSVLKNIINKKNRIGFVQLRFVLSFLFTKIGQLASSDLNAQISYYIRLSEKLGECSGNATPLCLKFVQCVRNIVDDCLNASCKTIQVLQIQSGLKEIFETQTNFLLPQNQQLLALRTQYQPITTTSESSLSNSSKKISDWWAEDGKSLIWSQKDWQMRVGDGFRQKLIAELLSDAGDSTEMLDAIKKMFNTNISFPKSLIELIFMPMANSKYSVFQEVLNKNNKTGLLQLKFLLEVLNTKTHSSVNSYLQEQNYKLLHKSLESYINNSLRPEFLELITKMRDVINKNINDTSSIKTCSDRMKDIFEDLQKILNQQTSPLLPQNQLPVSTMQPQTTTTTTTTVIRPIPLRPLIINTAVRRLQKKQQPQN